MVEVAHYFSHALLTYVDEGRSSGSLFDWTEKLMAYNEFTPEHGQVGRVWGEIAEQLGRRPVSWLSRRQRATGHERVRRRQVLKLHEWVLEGKLQVKLNERDKLGVIWNFA